MTLHVKKAFAWFTTISLKSVVDQVWIRYPCFCFFNLFIILLVFLFKSYLWVVHYLLITNNRDRVYRNKHFRRQRKKFFYWIKGYKGIAKFVWRVTWNYVISPFIKFGLVITIKFQLKGVDPLSPKSPFDYKWVVPVSFKTSAGTTYNVLLQNKVPLHTGRISKSLL